MENKFLENQVRKILEQEHMKAMKEISERKPAQPKGMALTTAYLILGFCIGMGVATLFFVAMGLAD